jgi:hypothetical protein
MFEVAAHVEAYIVSGLHEAAPIITPHRPGAEDGDAGKPGGGSRHALRKRERRTGARRDFIPAGKKVRRPLCRTGFMNMSEMCFRSFSTN